MSQNEPVMSQRARFERWFSDQGKWPEAVERSGEGYKLMQHNQHGKHGRSHARMGG